MAKSYLDKTGLERVWSKIKTLLSGKVDKISGKGLSTNDYTQDEKTKVSTAYSNNHTHENKSVLETITDAKVREWDDAARASVMVQNVGHLSIECNSWHSLSVSGYNHARLICIDVGGSSATVLKVRANSSTGATVINLASNHIKQGFIIEKYNNYVIFKSADGSVFGKAYVSTTKLYFYLEAENSSDYVDLVFAMES